MGYYGIDRLAVIRVFCCSSRPLPEDGDKGMSESGVKVSRVIAAVEDWTEADRARMSI